MRGGWLGEGWQGGGVLEREGKSTIKITEVSITLMSKDFPVPEVVAEVLGFDLSAKGAGETWREKRRKRSGFHTGFLPVPPFPPPPLPTSLYEALEIYNSGKLGPGYIASFNTVLIPSYYSLHHVRSLHFSEVLESVTDFCSAWSQGHSVSSERQQAPCQKKVPRRRRRLSEGLRKRMGLLNIQSPSQQSKWSRLFAG